MADGPGRESGTAPDMIMLGQEFRTASDAKLKKVTGLIDRMPNRGAADALLAPVRDRLAALRPVRNMNRNRLLFTPFDQILVRPARWQPGSFCLPRSALGPVIALLDQPGKAALPPPPPFDAADPAELLRCGRPLWEAAAARLVETTIPQDWGGAEWESSNGMSVASFRDLLPVMAMVFRWAHAIRALPSPRDPSLEATLLTMLTASARCGPVGWGIMLTLLLDAVPADLVTRVAGAIARGDRLATLLRTGVDHAVAQMLGRLEQMAQPPQDMPPAEEPSLLLHRLAMMQRLAGLRDMENRPGFEQKRIARIEQTLDASNRMMFQRSLRSQHERFEAATRAGTDPDTGTVLAIEADARRLRAFATGAAVLEGGRDYQSMLDALVQGLAVSVPPASAVTRLRLVELLGGSERALQMAGSMGAVPGRAS